MCNQIILRSILIAALTGIFLAVWACDSTSSNDNGNDIQSSYTLSVTVEPAGAGTVTPTSGEFEANTEVTVTASAESGWEFSGWSGSLSSTNNPLIFSITNNTNLTANFEEIPKQENSFTYKGNVYPLGWGVIFDHGEFIQGFRSFDFILTQVEEEVIITEEFEIFEDVESAYIIYLWMESIGAESFDSGTYPFSNYETINDNHLYDGELAFYVNGVETEYYYVVGGEVIVTITGNVYTLEFDLTLDNDERLEGKFTHNFEVFDIIEDIDNGSLSKQSTVNRFRMNSRR